MNFNPGNSPVSLILYERYSVVMKYIAIKGIYTEALLKDNDKHLFHENKS